MKSILSILFFFITQLLYAENLDSTYYIEQAGKIEKSSGLFAIALYEKAFELELTPKQKAFLTGKLFDLYLNHSKIEEIMILSKNNELDKSRSAKMNHLNQTLANNIGMSDSKFQEFIECLLNKDYSSRKKLLHFYAEDKSIYILNYIFAIKYKLQDFESLGYLISEAPDMSPSLRLAYLIKTNSKDVERKLRDFARISDLTDDQRMEILFLYGIYLQKKRRYKQSARYFRMSASFDKRKNHSIKMGILEAAKSLFITGKGLEACTLIGKGKISVQNETDELLRMYCDPKKQKSISKYLPAIEVLSQHESGLIFRSYLKLYAEDYPKKTETNNENDL